MEVTQKEWKDLWNIVREDERQNGIQNANIKNLCDKLDTQVRLTDRYFEAMDKRDKESARRYDDLVDRQEKREEKFWKAIAVLIGAVLILALGPKAAEKLVEAYKNPAGTAMSYCTPMPNNDRLYIFFSRFRRMT